MNQKLQHQQLLGEASEAAKPEEEKLRGGGSGHLTTDHDLGDAEPTPPQTYGLNGSRVTVTDKYFQPNT